MDSHCQLFLAKALYDNVSETPQELSFRRGDLLTVLQQNAQGFPGWWLCSLRGQEGIAPGNRLKVVSGMGEHSVATQDRGQHLYKTASSGARTKDLDYDVPPPRRDFLSARSTSRRPSCDVVMPSVNSRKASIVDELCNSPAPGKRESSGSICGVNSNSLRKVSFDVASCLYDTPPSDLRHSAGGVYHTLPTATRTSAETSADFYDTPPTTTRTSTSTSADFYDTHTTATRISTESSAVFYDTPPTATRTSTNTSADFYDTPTTVMRISTESSAVFYDTPPTATRTSTETFADFYDTPSSNDRRSSNNAASFHEAPNGSKRISDYESVQESYDIPPKVNHRGSCDYDRWNKQSISCNNRLSSDRTLPHSNRSSLSRESNPAQGSQPDLLLRTHQQSQFNSGMSGFFHNRRGSNSSQINFDAPTRSNRSSLEHNLTEEETPIYESISPTVSVEDLNSSEPMYDLLSVQNPVPPKSQPTSHTSLCSAASSESLLSNTSGFSSARMSQDSARSSMDLPLDIYDIPSGCHDSRKQLSVDSGLGFLDSPTKSRPSSSNSNNDTTRFSHSLDSKLTLNSVVDEFYNTQTNNGKKVEGRVQANGPTRLCLEPSTLYDVPSQTTRDSAISLGCSCSRDSQRSSSVSSDGEQQLVDLLLWDELILDLDSAMDHLTKKQQDVSKAATRLCGFVHGDWKSRVSLEKTLYDIKVACTRVKCSLHDFVDFSRGTIANAARIPDYNLASLLKTLVSPLKNRLETVNRCFLRLEDMKWQVSLLSEPQGEELDQLVQVATDVMLEVKKVAAFVQDHGHLLFRKASPGGNNMADGCIMSSVEFRNNQPNGRRGSTLEGRRGSNIQQRPLPAVPQERASPSDVAKMAIYAENTATAASKCDYTEITVAAVSVKCGCAEVTAASPPKGDYAEITAASPLKGDYAEIIVAAVPVKRDFAEINVAAVPPKCDYVKMTVADVPTRPDYAEITVAAVPAKRDYAETTVGAVPAKRDYAEITVGAVPAKRDYAEITVAAVPAKRDYSEITVAAIPAKPDYAKITVDAVPAKRDYAEITVAAVPAKRDYAEITVAAIPAKRDYAEITVAAVPAKRDYAEITVAAVPAKRDYAEITVAAIPAKRDNAEYQKLNTTPTEVKGVAPNLHEYDFLQLDVADMYTRPLESADTDTQPLDVTDVYKRPLDNFSKPGSQLSSMPLYTEIKSEQATDTTNTGSQSSTTGRDQTHSHSDSHLVEMQTKKTCLDGMLKGNIDLDEVDTDQPESTTPVNSEPDTSQFPLPHTNPWTAEISHERLDPNDRQVLVFYMDQINSHSTLLDNATQAFLSAVQQREPPNVFVSHSKFLTVSAHKLVHIGDSIHRNLTSSQTSGRVMRAAGRLCDCLKASVLATKTAALNYPSAQACQQMVDAVLAVSRAANTFQQVVAAATRR